MEELALENLADPLEAVKLYIEEWGLSVIPLKAGEKVPALSWAQYQQRPMTYREALGLTWHNVGIVTGRVSQLVVLDADTQEGALILEQFEELARTAKVRTKRGVHYYITVPDLSQSFSTRRIVQGQVHIDVKANSGYVVAPPSVVDGHRYVWLCSVQNGGRPFVSMREKELRELIAEIELKAGFREGTRRLNIGRMLEVVLPKYREGVRQDTVLFLSGWLKKLGVPKQEVEQLVKELCRASCDRDEKQRLSAVEYTYAKDETELKGISGLLALGFDEQQLRSALEDEQMQDLGDGFFEQNGLVYFRQRGKGKEEYVMLGPRIKIAAKVLDQSDVLFEVEYDGKTDLLREIKDTEKIRRLTGLAVVREAKYLEWLNMEVLKCSKTKHIKRETGWQQGVFYHPALQTDWIWEHWLVKRRLHLPRKKDLQHEIVKTALREGRMLGFLYAVSFATILNEPTGSTPLCIFVSGPAGVGKTTLCQLATNLFYDSSGFTISANATQAGMELVLKSMKDLPLLFDECTLKNVDLEKVVFMVSSRIGRVRGTKNLTISFAELNSNVMFTSEISETEEFARAGAHRRFAALTLDKWETASQAVSLKQALRALEACGAGLDFIRFCIERYADIPSYVEKMDQAVSMFPGLERAVRPIFTAIKMLEDFYKEDLSALYDYTACVFIEQKNELEQKKDIKRRFLEEFTQFLVQNYFKIYDRTKSESDLAKNEIIGERDGNAVYILTNVFTEFCTAKGFEIKTLLKELESAGILIPESTKATRKRKRILNQIASVYHIQLPPEWGEDLGM